MSVSFSLNAISESVVRFFPPPPFLVPPLAGIDISDASVKYLILVGRPGHFIVRAWGTVALAPGIVVDGKVQDVTALGKTLQTIAKKERLTAAHFALPEEHAYLFQMPLPRDVDANIEESIEFNLKENVPLTPEEVVFSYLVSGHASKESFLAVSAYPRSVIAGYLEAAGAAGITVCSFETEGHAIARASLDNSAMRSTMLVLDMGWNTTGLSITRGGVILFSTQLETTGKACCRAIERETGMVEQEAYALMMEQGVRAPAAVGARKAFHEVLARLEEEMEKHLAYWNVHAEGNAIHESISGVVVAGSVAAVPGFLESLASLLPVPVRGAHVWEQVCSFETYVPPIPQPDSYAFATAIGLALRSAPLV